MLEQALHSAGLKNLTTYKIGGFAENLLLCKSTDDILDAMTWTKQAGVPCFTLGSGSNILVGDEGFPGLVIKLAGDFKKVSFDDDILEVGAGVLLPALSSQLIGKGWGGFEFMCGIPGTIGGAVRMNAGTKDGKIEDHFISANVLSSNGQIQTLTKQEMAFGHRTSRLASTREIVLTVKFKLPYSEGPDHIKRKIKAILSDRKSKQPKIRRNCGSVFKSPPGDKSAGWYIDQAGLKRLRIGDAMVAHEHANWIVNLGVARAEDVKSLIRKVQDSVFQKFGIILEREVIYVPEDVVGD